MLLQTISLKIHSRISSKLQSKIIFWKWICIWSFWLLSASVIRFSVVNQRRLQAQHILRKYTNTDSQIQKYKQTNMLSGSSVANQAQHLLQHCTVNTIWSKHISCRDHYPFLAHCNAMHPTLARRLINKECTWVIILGSQKSHKD